jgi:hypothetical protein
MDDAKSHSLIACWLPTSPICRNRGSEGRRPRIISSGPPANPSIPGFPSGGYKVHIEVDDVTWKRLRRPVRLITRGSVIEEKFESELHGRAKGKSPQLLKFRGTRWIAGYFWPAAGLIPSRQPCQPRPSTLPCLPMPFLLAPMSVANYCELLSC